VSLSLGDIPKLKWRCRRGTKELDFLLEAYLINKYSQASSEEQKLFVELLSFQDSELILYLLGGNKPESKNLDQLIYKIRDQYVADW